VGLSGTRESSDLAIKSLNELCCRKKKVQWKAERETLRLMYGSAGAEKIFLIHPCISSKCTVLLAPAPRSISPSVERTGVD
jgi:hypothetical protein